MLSRGAAKRLRSRENRSTINTGKNACATIPCGTGILACVGFDFSRSHMLTHDLPIVVQIVDSAENIQRLLPVVEEMMDKGLIAISDVTAARIQKAVKNQEPMP